MEGIGLAGVGAINGCQFVGPNRRIKGLYLLLLGGTQTGTLEHNCGHIGIR